MKLVVAGASGFVATEIIRQCLQLPKISKVIALARRPVSAPPDLSATADASKLQSVVIGDYDVYPEEVKAQLAGVDACIWYGASMAWLIPLVYGWVVVYLYRTPFKRNIRATGASSSLACLSPLYRSLILTPLPFIRTVAITPSKARALPFEQVRRVCHDYTLLGLETLFAASKQGGREKSNNTQPFRFLYMSGAATERDQGKTPRWEPRYCLMRVSHSLPYTLPL